MKCIIIGCSGLGREVLWLCRRNGVQVEGFLDDNTELFGQRFEDVKVLGSIDNALDFVDYHFIVSIGAPRIRSAIVRRLKEMGVTRFTTLIDKDAIIGQSSTVGEGCIIFPGALITVACSIGEQSIINKNCSIGHDTKIEEFCTLAPLSMLGGHVHLESEVEIGASACVRQGLTIGQGAMVGMGSVVVKPVQRNSIMIGNPAKPFLKNK